MSKQKHTAFTIVELLVVITIIGILMALIVPAISGARERARQASCVNNQSQIGKAALSYATRKNKMPAVRSGTRNYEINWVHILLADIDRADLHALVVERVQTIKDTRGGQHPGAVYSYEELLFCPSDAPPTRDGAPLSYVANGGLSNVRDATPHDWPENGALSDTLVFPANGPEVVNTISSISKGDGTSNTIMFSENVDAGHWGSDAPAKIDPAIREVNVAILWPVEPEKAIRINQGIASKPLDVTLARPSSRHSGGVVVTYCDGHTDFISEEIDMRVYGLLMTSNGKRARLPGTNTFVPYQKIPLNKADLEP